MNLQRKLKVSISRALVDKIAPDNRAAYAESFENIELTVDELIRHVAYGLAICAQVSGHRSAANFLCADLVCVDVDNGMAISEALDRPLVKAHALFIYTTVNHTPERHRFRIVFALATTITIAADLAAVARSLALRLNGDPAATDATRISFGSTAAQVHLIGNELSDEVVADLIDQSARAAMRDTVTDGMTLAPTRSRLKIPPSELLRLARGGTTSLRDATPGARVFCPKHADNTPSAFIARSANGINGVHCSTCATTFWPEDTDAYDFEQFPNLLRAAHAYFHQHRDYGPLFNVPQVKHGLLVSRVSVVCDAPAPSKLAAGLTLVKSPKGSGKTEALKRLIGDGERVLSIGHRRSLIRETCKRLGLSCYLDRNDWSPAEIRERQARYGICLDSLGQIPPESKYDVVILDESEQLLAHFLSDTLERRKGGSRDRLFVLLRHLVATARYVVALDADLNWPSFVTLSRMCSVSAPGADGVPVRHPTKPIFVWFNEGAPAEERTIEVVDSENDLTGMLRHAVSVGKRCFVTSNSRAKVEALHAALASEFPDRRQILITSATIGHDDVRKFIESAKTETLSYDVILTSPSVGTGVDITFPDNAKLVDCVFGFCESRITTHLDFDQQLARVRHPGEVRVWINPRRFYFETSQDVVKDNLLRESLYKNLLLDFDQTGQPIYEQDDAFIDMASLIISRDRASKNDLKRHFVSHKQAQGVRVVTTPADQSLATQGRLLLTLGTGLRDANFEKGILEAEPLKRKEFEGLRELIEADEPLPPAARLSLERMRLELFYREPATPALIELDARGRYRDRVRLFETLTSVPAPLLGAMVDGGRLDGRLRFVKSSGDRAFVMLNLLLLTPLFPEAALDQSATVQSGDLRGFIDFVVANKAAIENVLDMQVRGDIVGKPIQQLNAILGPAGLKLVKSGTFMDDTRKIYLYELHQPTLSQLAAVVSARKAEAGWSAMSRIHGWDEADEEDRDSEEE
jgi:hypothetical protein